MPKRTPLYEEHKKLGAKIVDFAGWELPIQYSGITDEHKTVREAAGLFDVSHMGTLEISGEKAADFLNFLTPSNITKVDVGQAQYSLLLKDDATIVDDIIIYRITKDKFFLVVNASNIEKDFSWIKSHMKEDVQLRDLSNHYTLIAIQGPKTA